MTTTLYIVPVSGVNYFDAAQLANVTILRVCRNGMGYDLTTTGPVGRSCKYTAPLGRIEFETDFNNDPTPTDVEPPDSVYVRYKF